MRPGEIPLVHPKNGPVPRVYEVTTAGRRALDQAALDLRDIGQLVVDFRGRHNRLSRRRDGEHHADIYQHLIPSMMEEAGEKLSAIIGRRRTGTDLG